jgi:radical SAM superfamily enzyme YgiQ (UPF0313 family)
MPRLLLIYPRVFNGAFGDFRHVRYLTGLHGLLNNSLATIAALTPENWNVRIIDENVEPIPFDHGWDLVGITGHAQNDCGDAARIAGRFRARGVPVASGGVAPTLGPERWRSFSDIVFVGEAEETWPRFIRDFEAGSFELEYRAGEHPDLANSPVPDYSGYPRRILRRYYSGIVQGTRGCPHRCEFCDVRIYHGREMRHKPKDHILSEIDALYRQGFRWIVIGDDNWGADRRWALESAAAFREFNDSHGRRLDFFVQTSMEISDDPELMAAAVRAGISRFCIGLESPDQDNLVAISKTPNLNRDLARAFRNIHEHGVVATATSVLGFDGDDTGVFQRQFEFFMDAGIVVPQPYPLQAIDSTDLTRRLKSEGRYLGHPDDVTSRRLNLFNTITFRPKGMEASILRQGVLWLNRELYSPENMAKRLLTWFDHFDDSPVRGSLDLASPWPDRRVRGIAVRLVPYLLARAPAIERRAARRMFDRARRSRHPRAFGIAGSAYLIMKNVHAVLASAEPDIREITEPGH